MADAPPTEATNEPSISTTGMASHADADAGTIRRLLLFFALVYVVEGLGQIVGLISQPLNYYLKEVHGWSPLQVTAFVTLFNLPWIIKPIYGLVSDFLPLFGYRRKSYLIIANIAATVGYLWVTQLNGPGDLVDAVRRRLGGERTAPQRERDFCQPAMALVQHRRDGGGRRRRPARAASDPVKRLACCGRHHRRRSLRRDCRHYSSGPGEKDPNRSGGSKKYASRPDDRVPPPRAMDRRDVYVSLLFQPGFEHASVLSHDRRSRLLASLYRDIGIGQRRGLGRRRAPLSPIFWKFDP